MDDPVGTGVGLVLGVAIAVAVLMLGGFVALVLIAGGLMLVGH